MAVKVVTDSTSDLHPELAESLGLTVVPLNVHFGTEEYYKDGIDLSADEFYERLVGGTELPKTSQPSVGDFIEVYERLGRDADGILSVHISSKLSGTFNSAVQARAQVDVGCPIEVIDTLQVSMGLGMTAQEAARAAQGGAGLEDVAEAARNAAERCQCIVLFETLEYLEKGGRIGKARALLGTLLRIRPLIIIQEGEVHELGKERTRTRGIARLKDIARGYAPLDEVCVLYSTTLDEAESIAEDLSDLLPDDRKPSIGRFGPVIGTYTGPGVLGIGLLRSATPSRGN
ncbi:MAG: DegV family protein [SAR202 cluster bacterium]|jgi:DegV family protein with EDD domain|nr:DegV family protein [SAR202 cluster bacterium]